MLSFVNRVAKSVSDSSTELTVVRGLMPLKRQTSIDEHNLKGIFKVSRSTGGEV